MAQTPEEFNQSVQRAISALNEKLPDLIDAQALDQIALFKNRVIQKGLNVDESGNEVAFPDYSEGYKKKREKKGLTASPNRLVFTGQMLRSLVIVGRVFQKGKYTTIVGGSNNEAQDKLQYNSDLYGDILQPSKAEEKIIQKAYFTNVVNIINKELK